MPKKATINANRAAKTVWTPSQQYAMARKACPQVGDVRQTKTYNSDGVVLVLEVEEFKEHVSYSSTGSRITYNAWETIRTIYPD